MCSFGSELQANATRQICEKWNTFYNMVTRKGFDFGFCGLFMQQTNTIYLTFYLTLEEINLAIILPSLEKFRSVVFGEDAF